MGISKRKIFELKNEKFQINYCLGRGGFGIVYKATFLEGNNESCLRPGDSVAIKEIDKSENGWENHKKTFVEQEIEIQRKLDHPNIVKLLYSVETKRYVYLILELCSEGSLDGYLKKKPDLSEEEVYNIFKQIVDGVMYLHSKLIIHRDLAPKNVLLTKHMEVKIADFNLSTNLKNTDEVKYTICGTRNYMPPEIEAGKGHNEKVDCWSLGRILYTLLARGKKLEREIHYPPHISYEAKELLEKLLRKEPTERICIEAVPETKFFKKYEKNRESKNSLYRSEDSGNGSRNHFSSPIEKESRFRSLDSGFNSKNSSSRKTKSDEKLTERRKLVLHNNELLPARKNDILRYDRSYNRKRSASEDRKPYNPLSYNIARQVYNSRERSASAERERIENLKLSSRHDYSNDACQIISSDYYRSQERCKNNDCGISSAWKTHRGFDPEPTEPCNDPSCRFSNSLLEGQHKVSPSTCSHAGCYDTKCSHVATCCCHSHSHQKHQISNINKPEKLNEHSLEQQTSPLNAARLRPKRYMIEYLNTVLHISADTQVIMENLKNKKGKAYVSEVFIISTDGMKIKMYKPPKYTLLNDRPPPFPDDPTEIKSYDYQRLPKIYHKRYLIAKQFVDTLQTKNPKLINNVENGRFYVMENSPDPDMKMDFYDGGSVLKKGQVIHITNKLGKKCTLSDTNTKNLDQDLNTMLEEFLSEKEDCEGILKFFESRRSPNFPIVIGRAKNGLNCSGEKTGKENIAPTSSRRNKR